MKGGYHDEQALYSVLCVALNRPRNRGSSHSPKADEFSHKEGFGSRINSSVWYPVRKSKIGIFARRGWAMTMEENLLYGVVL